MQTWRTPAGTASGLYMDMLNQSHLLIAGATGSGKSVLINGLIYTALYRSPNAVRLVLIDPKRVELCQYRKLPHALRYASEPADMVKALTDCVDLMERRYKAMQSREETKSDEAAVYIIIDELADLLTTNKREVLPILCRLAQLGRAANVHLIGATQRPTKDVLSGQLKVNLDARVALRCPTPQDSRNIIDRKGAETLPRYGKGYYLTPELFTLTDIPRIDPEELQTRVAWWMNQNTATAPATPHWKRLFCFR